jgi:mannose-1-phosphate guanylyltransferase / mannose-6-phosphate isomerase
MLIPVILCGGSGSRLWPASRDGFPKPFMTLPDGDTLIAKTVRRARAVAPGAPILFVAGAQHSFLIRNAMQAIGDTGPAHYISEPMGRNTAPAVAIAALWAQAAHGDAARILVLPADHLIQNQTAFAKSVARADAAAQTGALVTFGIAPTAPETGYGYLQQGTALADETFRVARFVEKPVLDIAKQYLAAGDYAWNSGMFCFGVGALLTEMANTAADVLASAKATLAASKTTGAETALDKDAFAKSPSISVDYAVMEKAKNVAMVRAAFDWSDVGAWPSLAETVPADAQGNRGGAGHELIDTANTFIQSGRKVATIGVNNVIVIDTADAILIADQSRAQDVKQVVDALKAKGSELTKLHMTVHRPWGTYTILEDKDDCKVKRIVVHPGASLSLQLHHKRSEHWVVVTGTATITNGDDVLTLQPGEATFIPVGTRHRLENKTNAPVAIIETQVGTYFGEDDIVRLEDRYGRA